VPHTVAEPSSDLILPSTESLQQEEISRALEARISGGRDTPAHQDGNARTSRQYGVGDQRHHPDCKNRGEGGLERKDDRASHNRHHGVFDDQRRPARPHREGEQHAAAIASTLPATVTNQRFSSVRVC
jgi:hypothetical protein